MMRPCRFIQLIEQRHYTIDYKKKYQYILNQKKTIFNIRIYSKLSSIIFIKVVLILGYIKSDDQ